MKSLNILVLLLLLIANLAFAGCATSTGSNAASVQVTVDLSDGSHLIGTADDTVIPVDTTVGKLMVPLSHVTTLTFRDSHAGLTMILTNGDRVTGVAVVNQLKITGAFGDVSLDPGIIRKIECRKIGGKTSVQNGLVLWNRLDSESDIRESCVGPGGTLTGGHFVPGHFGNAIELNMDEPFGVTFPINALTTTVGCIEFWAKLSDFPSFLPPDCATPGLLGWDYPGQDDSMNYVFFFNANNGASGGGLCVRASFVNFGTGASGRWTYSRAVGGGNVADWHHYAIAWNANGLPDIGDGACVAAIFFDGKLLASSHKTFPSPCNFLDVREGGRFGLINHERALGSGRVAFENLKIWNYAKTDFSNRNER